MSEQAPWRVDRLKINDEVVIRAGDEVAFICMVFGPNKERDARLIAATPDLLAALRAIHGLHGKPMREEWLNDAAFELAKKVDAQVYAAIDAAVGPMTSTKQGET